MTKRHTPPARISNKCVVVVNPFGPHHCARCLGSVHAEKTRSRGASNTRVPMIEHGSVSRSMLFFAATFFLLRLQNTQIIVEPVETLFPEPAILLEPVVRFLERGSLDPAWPHLGIAAACDQTSALEHFQMLGNRRQTHVERLGEL